MKRIVIFMLILSFYVNATSQQRVKTAEGTVVEARVTHKERIVEYSDDTSTVSYYLIYTDKETFKLTYGLVFGTINSDDIYGNLQVGETYKFNVAGIRSGFFGLYRIILDVHTKDGKSINKTINNNEKRTYIVKVTGKECVDGTYLVYTTEGTFKIEDSLIFGRFNSSDIYGMMQVGSYYKITVFGVRSAFLESYRNIIEVKTIE